MPLNESSIEYRILREVAPAAVERLYRAAGWWEENYTPDFIAPMLAGSFRFVGAFDAAGEMIGMGRAVSDGCSDAYIQDIVVAPAWRHAGIGGRIVTELLKELHAADIDWIGLIAAPGTENFYSGLGFERMREYIPMIYNRNKAGES